MAEARTGCTCITILKWIWTQVKRRFSYMVENSQDNQVVVDVEASASLPSSSSAVQDNQVVVSMASSASLPSSAESSSSSSSSTAHPCKYDVFLSFRGPDTRRSITSELNMRLHNRGIKTFMDDRDLEVGDAISPTLLKAIEESRFAIVVLSPNYASSTWCLEELAKICECMKDQNRILPLFYDVEPTNVRFQKRSLEEAFNTHESSGRHTSENVQRWKDALNKVASFSGWDSNNYKTDRELVEKIVDSVCNRIRPVDIDLTLATEDFEEFEATKQAMGQVMKVLQDVDVPAIGVYGMGGVGKTTLVKHVAAKCRKSGIFPDVIMAVVSQNLDLKTIQATLAAQLSIKLSEETEIGRIGTLNKEIMRREKLLIILDDVWGRTELSKIGIPSYMELKKRKSKVLLTTRRLNVCLAMKCQEKISLNVLSKEDSLTLFLRNARIMSFASTTFAKVVKRVAAECKGLPIALIAVARALGDKDLAEWEKAAQRLEKSQRANLDHEEDAFTCIKLSYDYLKDKEYKSFFLLCCLFPEDHYIIIEDLFRYAIGIGLFQNAETIYEARGTAYTVVEHLKDSSLLLKSDLHRCVWMHDVVRDTALNIAKSEGGHRFLVKAGCGLDDWPSRLLLHEGSTAISLMHNRIRKLPQHLVCPELQILSLSHNDELRVIPETFFQTPNELRVLDLSWTGISYLPQSFGLLTNLRALYLDCCYNLTDISMVGKLTKLEVLSVQSGGLKELSREIGNLTNLRVLDITGGDIYKIPSKLLSKLRSLEELYLQCEFGDWGSKVDGEGDETNSAFDEVTGLSKLRILHVSISNEERIPKRVELNPNWVGFFICIGKDEKMLTDIYGSYEHHDIDQRTIFLKLDSIRNFPDWFFNTVINKAEKLCWCDCPCIIDVFVEYERGRLHSLKQLELYGEDEDELYGEDAEDEDDLYGTDDEDDLYGTDDEDNLMNTSTWVPNGIPKKKTWVPKELPLFENLEELYLRRLDWAELRAVEFLPTGSLRNLKLLNVCSCYNSGNVFLPSTSSERLPNLEELECSSMDEIEYVFGYEALPETEQSKLRKIVLFDLVTVRSIREGPTPPAMFQNLQILSIYSCNQLQGSLFTYDVAQCLSQLTYFNLEDCPLLHRIVDASNKTIILPRLKTLTLRGLPVLYYESSTFECPSLEILHLYDCPKFSASVPDFHSRKQIQLHEH